jgi:hypothetical protein
MMVVSIAQEDVTAGTFHFMKKLETGASDAFSIGLPAVMLFISPIPAIPAFMLVVRSSCVT